MQPFDFKWGMDKVTEERLRNTQYTDTPVFFGFDNFLYSKIYRNKKMYLKVTYIFNNATSEP